MSSQETLRGKLGKFTLATIIFVCFAALTIIGAQSYFSLKSKRISVADSLIRSSHSQNDLLIPTFILPEQQKGQVLVLEGIVREDGLETAKIIFNKSEIPSAFARCSLEQMSSSCLNGSKDSLATVTPITDAGQTFGYLLKIKRLESMASPEQSYVMMGAIALVLVFTFAVLFWGMNRFTSREVPNELDALIKWVEEFLSEKGPHLAPNLKFKEFNFLGQKISELIDRHDQARDQAIIGQFVSGIMHDIRTPLQSIVAALELLNENKDDPEGQKQLLDNLYHVSRIKIPLIGQIIETTLDGSRSIHVERQSANITKTVAEAINIHRDYLERKKGKIDISAPSKPLVALYDPTQLIRVISNLVKNGIESASEDGKSPALAVQVEELPGNRISISVEDSGKGLQLNPERVFRVFRSKKKHGTGLGLLISRKIIESHEGELTVKRSEKLGGAKFEINLPRGEFSITQADVLGGNT